MHVLARGEIPLLTALRLHNGTVWPWNRACYGVKDGVAHLRIENRVLPSGPTLADAVANAAFFSGLMLALPEEYGDIGQLMEFDDAKANLFAAARYGLNSQLKWIGGGSDSASSLILRELLPLARQGLSSVNVNRSDINKYLGIIEERVRSGQTGAQWMLSSFSATDGPVPRDFRYRALTETMLQHQKKGSPVHTWPLMTATTETDWSESYQTVGQFMTTDLFTLQPDDPLDFAASVMDWRHIRHVPVENDQGELVGLLTHRALLRVFSRGLHKGIDEPMSVRDLMTPDPLTVSSATSSLEAMDVMRSNRVGCLPVVDDGQLVGIVTSFDFLDASARLFKEHLTKAQTKPLKVLNANSQSV
jgi:CBS domain-containing protein